jgi:hypothetical protein
VPEDPTTRDVAGEAGERDPLQSLADSIEGVRERLVSPAPAPLPVAAPAPVLVPAAGPAEEPPQAELVAFEAAPITSVIELQRFEELMAGLPAVRSARAVSYARGAALFEVALAYPGAPWADELRRVLPSTRVWVDDGGSIAVALASPAASEATG